MGGYDTITATTMTITITVLFVLICLARLLYLSYSSQAGSARKLLKQFVKGQMPSKSTERKISQQKWEIWYCIPANPCRQTLAFQFHTV